MRAVDPTEDGEGTGSHAHRSVLLSALCRSPLRAGGAFGSSATSSRIVQVYRDNAWGLFGHPEVDEYVGGDRVVV